VQGEEAASKVVAVTSPKSNETIHIFAVASGHLYERLMKIMVLSIIKRTDRPVKFWFIKNYLSPKFKVRLSRWSSTTCLRATERPFSGLINLMHFE
jgi:hypothetical protein